VVQALSREECGVGQSWEEKVVIELSFMNIGEDVEGVAEDKYDRWMGVDVISRIE
jgi:hypothetical protein